MVIVQKLGRVLPDRYIAEPRVHPGSQAEVDVATLDRFENEETDRAADEGQASRAWAQGQPTLAVKTELSDPDEYEVRVYDAEHGRRLVAAVEIISPANKDRPESRGQFVAKCDALLRQGVSIVLVDLVTMRNFNLYAQLLEWVGERDETLGDDPPCIYAAACRWHPRGGRRWLEGWNRPLAPGQPLPVLPLWLSERLTVPLDLEASYEQTCRDLRIP